MTYEQALKIILLNEGGYVNDPNDSGGETYCGISRNNFPNWDGWHTIDVERGCADFPNSLSHNPILLDSLSLFYFDMFWTPLKLNGIKNDMLKLHIFDEAVNTGTHEAIILLQSIIGVTQDGCVGNDTLNTTNNYPNQLELAQRYMLGRDSFYQEIVKKKPENQKYLKGWLQRVANTEMYGEKIG